MLRRVGLSLRISRTHNSIRLVLGRAQQAEAEPSVSPIFDDPYEALFYRQGGADAAFHCPIDKCVNVNGLSFSDHGWHPFSALLEEYRGQAIAEYHGSVLEKYYRLWQPQCASEALIDVHIAPPVFERLPPHFMYLFPWTAGEFCELDRSVKSWYMDDNVEHGNPPGKIETDGFKEHGPVDPQIGLLEFRRLTGILDRLSSEGYRRELGDVRVAMIKRDDDLRFLNWGGGLHRTAAMKVLGHSTVPATFVVPWVIDSRDVDYWPQVRKGNWTRETALRYVDHLFDFDSKAWASSLGLVDS
jgi:hypothetical protein